jgi:hypothetical protein
MTWRLALRSLASQPVRSAVLTCGFGLGIACMAGLLGVGNVILDQSRSRHLRGGGDLVIYGAAGPLGSARFLTSQAMESSALKGRARVASPSLDATVYLVEAGGSEVLAIQARGGIPSLERALEDPETSGVDVWRDTAGDRAWASPAAGSVLRAMDRFHPVPDVPARADSWAEWLYFNGTADDTRFNLTFFVGPRVAASRRSAAVRLQLEHNGRTVHYFDREEIAEEPLLAEAPDISIGDSRVRLEGRRYHVKLALDAEDRDAPPVSGEIVIDAVPGRSIPPFEIAGAGGWVSGYTVPVLSGPLGGALEVGGRVLSLEGGVGYHDHNWGFWEGVTWQWGQVAHDDLAVLYGRIQPPADVAAAERIPGFLAVLGAEGPLGFSTEVTIEETDDPGSGQPTRIVVRGAGETLHLEMVLTVEAASSTRLGRALGDTISGGRFLQLRAQYRVSGTVGSQAIDFAAAGSAETFRGTERQESGM